MPLVPLTNPTVTASPAHDSGVQYQQADNDRRSLTPDVHVQDDDSIVPSWRAALRASRLCRRPTAAGDVVRLRAVVCRRAVVF